jgi:4-amino-4-deoxy-L-arabinose transferase-like glycosyltransferase
MNRPQVRWLLVVSAVWLWFIAVLPAYYVVHKPLVGGLTLPPPNASLSAQDIASTVLSTLTDLGLLAITVLVSAAWGSRLSRWVGADSSSDLERWTMGAILGLGLLGTLVFGLGLVSAYHPWIGYAFLLVLGLGALPEIRAQLGYLRSALHRPRFRPIPWLWVYVSAMGLLSLGLALLPPTGWDALVYHLQGPRLYLENHRLIPVIENFYLNWPAQAEMLFTWGMLLKGDTLAKLFHWVFWLLTASLLYSLTRKTLNRRAGQWAVALWASVPVAIELAGLAYVDLALTAFVLAGAHAFLSWTDSRKEGWLVLSAAFIGLAMATKYTAVSWLGLILLLLVFHAWRHHRRPISWIVSRSAAFALIAGLVVTPWLVKNWIVTGNPVYPFLFGGNGWNETREAWLTLPTLGGYSRNLLDYLALPWLLTAMGTTGTAAFDATIGPLLLCLVPLLVISSDRPRAVRYGLLLVAGQLLIFSITIWRTAYLVETRLLLPAFPLLCLAAAFVLHRLTAWDRPTFHLSRVVRIVVGLVLLTTLITESYAFLSRYPFAPLVGLESRESYLARGLGVHWHAMRETSTALSNDSRILFLWEPRGYYYELSALPDATLDNLSQLRMAYGDANAAALSLAEAGFTHFLLYRSGLEFLGSPATRPPTLNSFLKGASLEESPYPLSDQDLQFLEELLTVCRPVEQVAGFYEIHQLPEARR